MGLKNAQTILSDVTTLVQFAVNEQCVQYGQCDSYSPFIASGKPVFHIEYPDSAPNSVSATERNADCNPPGGTEFSTVMKNMTLGGWVAYCDGSYDTTPTQNGDGGGGNRPPPGPKPSTTRRTSTTARPPTTVRTSTTRTSTLRITTSRASVPPFPRPGTTTNTLVPATSSSITYEPPPPPTRTSTTSRTTSRTTSNSQPTNTGGGGGGGSGCRSKHWDQCGGQNWNGCTQCDVSPRFFSLPSHVFSLSLSNLPLFFKSGLMRCLTDGLYMQASVAAVLLPVSVREGLGCIFGWDGGHTHLWWSWRGTLAFVAIRGYLCPY
jgi:hypothetical protein